MSENAVVSKIKGSFSASVLDVVEHRGETTVTVKKEDIVAVCRFLKEQGFNFLTDLTAVDLLDRKPRFMMVYQLQNLSSKERLRLKSPVEESDARIETVSGVWATANWLEREVFDMFGLAFDNHPDLRRMLMPDDWEGHPLRKDYPVQGPDRAPYQGRVQ